MNKKDVKIIPLGDLIISIKTGLNPRGTFLVNTKDATYDYITTRELQCLSRVNRQSGGTMYETDKIDDEARKLIIEKTNLAKGDILFPAVTANGKVPVYVDKDEIDFGVSENVYVIKPKEDIDGRYLVYALRSEFVQKQMAKNSCNLLTKNMNKNAILQLMIPVPPIDGRQRITKMLEKMDETMNEMYSLMEMQIKQYQYYNNTLFNEIVKGEDEK